MFFRKLRTLPEHSFLKCFIICYDSRVTLIKGSESRKGFYKRIEVNYDKVRAVKSGSTQSVITMYWLKDICERARIDFNEVVIAAADMLRDQLKTQSTDI